MYTADLIAEHDIMEGSLFLLKASVKKVDHVALDLVCANGVHGHFVALGSDSTEDELKFTCAKCGLDAKVKAVKYMCSVQLKTASGKPAVLHLTDDLAFEVLEQEASSFLTADGVDACALRQALADKLEGFDMLFEARRGMSSLYTADQGQVVSTRERAHATSMLGKRSCPTMADYGF